MSPLLALYGILTKAILSPFFRSEGEERKEEIRVLQLYNIACLLFVMVPLFIVAIINMTQDGIEADFCTDAALV